MRNRFILIPLAIFIAGISHASYAQELLTVDDALKIALQNNYAIQVAKNDAEIAKNNNRVGAAGMLPFATGTASQDNQVVNTQQSYINGTENNRDGAKSNTLGANVELGWTIFDGLKMFTVKNRLEELQKIGELRMRSQIEQTFLRVIRAYYDVVLAKEQLRSNTEAFELSKKRLELADDKLKAGKSPRTELLKAQVDLNTDKAALMRQENVLKNTKSNLNQALARDLNIQFDVVDTITGYKEYKLEELMNKGAAQNANLLVAKKTQFVNMLAVREIRAERLPLLQLKGGYNYNRQESEAGFLQSAQTSGIHYGAGVSLNLFNGFDVDRRIQNAKINLRSSELMYKDSLLRVQNLIQQAYNNFMLSMQLIDFEDDNLVVARQNYEIADEQYKVGVITAIELRDAQQNLLNNQLRLLTAQYEAKLNETELLRLTGQLMQLPPQ